MELALATAAEALREESEIRVVIDRRTGDYESFRSWTVVADDVVAVLGTEFTTEEAHEDTNLQVGDAEEQVENIAFGRIAAQTAKSDCAKRA